MKTGIPKLGNQANERRKKEEKKRERKERGVRPREEDDEGPLGWKSGSLLSWCPGHDVTRSANAISHDVTRIVTT